MNEVTKEIIIEHPTYDSKLMLKSVEEFDVLLSIE